MIDDKDLLLTPHPLLWCSGAVVAALQSRFDDDKRKPSDKPLMMSFWTQLTSPTDVL